LEQVSGQVLVALELEMAWALGSAQVLAVEQVLEGLVQESVQVLEPVSVLVWCTAKSVVVVVH
jgi:hypothetical protein